MSIVKSNGKKILVAINDPVKEALFIPKLEAMGYSVVKVKSFQKILEFHTKNRSEIIMLTPFGLNNDDIHSYVKLIKIKNPKAIICIYKGDYFQFVFKKERENDLSYDIARNTLEPPFDVKLVDYYIWSSYHPIQAYLNVLPRRVIGYYLPKILINIRNLKFQRKPKTYMDMFEQLPGMKQLGNYFAVMSKNGTTEDIHPKGIGRFGYDVTNPIPANNIFGSEAYLKRLRDKNGNPIKYERLGSTETNNIENPIDKYKITDSNGSVLGIVYISPYQKTISRKAPDGFLMS